MVGELRRRNVFKVASVYLITAWIIMQIVSVISPYLHLPKIFGTAITVILILAFPVACIFAWAFELTPEGIKPTKQVDKDESIADHTGKKLSITLGVLLVGVVSFVIYDKAFDTEPKQVNNNQTQTSQAESHNEQASTQTEDLSIAVLPFVNMSNDAENEFFSDGLTEEILNKLARVPKLLVTARTSSFFYKGTNEDLRDIGSKLGVAYILEGSVRKSNNIARITAQLIRVSDGFHLWSDTYDKNIENTFIVQDEIATSVTTALNIVLDEKSRIRMKNTGLADVEAFIAYQKGLKIYNEAHTGSLSVEDLLKANEYFDIVIQHVPDFPGSCSFKSDYDTHIALGDDPKFSMEEQLVAKDRALKLLQMAIDREPDIALQAYMRITTTLLSNNWSGLKQHISEIKDLNNCPRLSWLEMVNYMGYEQLIYEIYQKHRQCDPLNKFFETRVIASLLDTKRTEEAIKLIEITEVNNPTSLLYTYKTFAYLVQKEFNLAEATIEKITDEEFNVYANFVLHAMQGNKVKIDEYSTLLAKFSEDEHSIQKRELFRATALGERDKANQLAAIIDKMPLGTLDLLGVISTCRCGAPFELDATPNFKKRIQEAHLQWPPNKVLDFPLKDW